MPLSWLYGSILNARNTLYKKGVFKSASLGVPTISVGNITVGGTGKTPLVGFIAELLANNGERVCILTRGYGRENPKQRVLVSDGAAVLVYVNKAGDEAFELAANLIGKAIVIADSNRLKAGMWAREKYGVTSFVLDDAFQHQKVRRDLDIVTIDATNAFGNEKTLPFGILRERLLNLRRAGLIIITRANLSDEITKLKSKVQEYNPNCPIILSQNAICELTRIEDFNGHLKESERQKKSNMKIDSNTAILAFCGLGNPDNFFNQLRRENYRVVKTQQFRDHHFYTQSDIDMINETANKAVAQAIFTTPKDAVKLKDSAFNLPCFVVENTLKFDDEKKLRQMIYAVLD